MENEMKSKSTETRPSIVFCHGIWADGSCFNKVIPTLQADGHQVIAAQYSLDTVLRQNCMCVKAIDYLAGSFHTPAHDRSTSMARNFDLGKLQRSTGPG